MPLDERVPWPRIASGWLSELDPPIARVRHAGRERLRSSVLNKAGMRDKDAFIGLSRGGDLAVKSALEHVKTVGLTGDYSEFGVF